MTVPDLVGLPWPKASQRLDGLWPLITQIAPLPPAKCVRGLDAFVVSSQDPAPGTRVPYMGVRIPHGVNLAPSTLRLTLAVR